MIQNSQTISNALIPTTYKVENTESDVPSVSFVGYSGQPVNLSDRGFEFPVVYNLATMKIPKQQIPIMYNHKEEIGHTTKVSKGAGVKGKGLLSVPNARKAEVHGALKNGYVYEASMGLLGDYSKISFHAKGTVTVNNRVLKAPIYVWDDTELKEMTLSVFGRDDETNFTLNAERRKMIRNSANDDTPPPAPPTPPTPPTPPSPPTQVNNTPPTPPSPPPTPPTQVNNTPPADFDVRNQFLSLMNRMTKYPQHTDLVKNSIENNWDDQRLDNEVQLVILRNNRTTPPGNHGNPTERGTILRARLYNSVGVTEENLIKRFGEKTAEIALNQGYIGLKELLVNSANMMGAHYTGFSDIEQLCTFLKNSGYSTFDMPNLFLGAGEALLDQWWKLDAPFAPTACKEESNQNFQPTQHIRPEGGQMWEGLDKEGKMGHAAFGKEHFYTSELDTIAQYLQLTRQVIENDSMNMVEEMLRMMVEGAMIVPDVRLLRHMSEDNGDFFVDNVNNFDGANGALTRANLSTIYKKIRKLTMNKGKVDFRNILNTRWTIVTGVEQEETAWEIIKQKKIVQETGAANGTKTGEENYWFGRLDVKTFAQIGNTSITANTAEDDWFLWPQDARFAPYTITYLRGRKRPTINQVNVPGDMLGFAVAGHWDVQINKREKTALFRCRPSR